MWHHRDVTGAAVGDAGTGTVRGAPVDEPLDSSTAGGGEHGGVAVPLPVAASHAAARRTVTAAPIPPHVLLNHLYRGVARPMHGGSGAAAEGGPQVFAVTTRYVDKGAGDKFVANVYYTPSVAR